MYIVIYLKRQLVKMIYHFIMIHLQLKLMKKQDVIKIYFHLNGLFVYL